MAYMNGNKIVNINLKVLTEKDKTDIAALMPTHEKYFEITDDGIISLKAAYRGASRPKDVEGALLTPFDASLSSSALAYSQSDNGWAKVGSKYYELPHEIIIPTTVNGITVTGFQNSAFAFNERITKVVLNSNITTLSNYLFYRAMNLEEVANTEQITAVGTADFICTSIKKIEFPNLQTLNKNAFKQCTQLEYVDIGKVTVLNDTTFQVCYNLKEVKLAENVYLTSISKGAFWGCYNLRKVDNLLKPNVTKNIGQDAFLLCRATYDWATLTGCTFGTGATANQLHATKFWENVNFTPCENKALSFLNQNDLRWQMVKVSERTGTGNLATSGVFGGGCSIFVHMGAWCSLNNVTVDDARDFSDICKQYGTDIKEIDGGTDTDSPSDYWRDPNNDFYEKMGLDIEYINAPCNAAMLQKIYNALAEGKYIGIATSGGIGAYTGHIMAITGITPTGELIIQDSANMFWQNGSRENAQGKIPIQNLIQTTQYATSGTVGFILSKKTQ